MREKIRDKTRDEFAKQLDQIGVTAIISDRERPEERVGNRTLRRSLGIIDIPNEDGPIKWINIPALRKDHWRYLERAGS